MSDALRRMHEAWLGMVQPIEGLVFSPTVLADKGVGRPDEAPAQLQKRFLALCPPSAIVDGEDARPRIADLPVFLEEMLGLTPDLFDAGDALPAALSLEVAEADQLLRPTLALKKQFAFEVPNGTDATEAAKAGAAYEMLIWDLAEHDAAGLDLDAPEAVTGAWRYPPTAKFDRLLRHVRVPLGLLTNREEIRLVYAPHGESTGHLTFRLKDMAEVGGRPILDAFVSLLNAHRFFGGLEDATPRALLEESRKRQANVTNELASQVFDALSVLLAGFQAAAERDPERYGQVFRDALEREDDHVYRGLLTVMLRLVFLLFAEDKGLLPVEHPLYAEHLSLLGLFERLQEDAGAHPDSMGQRFGAWSQLLVLFRAIYTGVDHGDLHMPARRGDLFNPHRYPFLEGFAAGASPLGVPELQAEVVVPTIDDGTVYAVLERLLVFEGQRLSYKALDVEQIGSIYESLMGYRVERVSAPAVRMKSGQWLTVDEVLAVKPAQRAKWFKNEVGLSNAEANRLAERFAEIAKDDLDDAAKAAAYQEALADYSAAGRKGDKTAVLARAGQLVLQPGAERRRTSSHYTPRSLSEPIVRRTLEPLLACMGEAPSSERILSLKICDPAMGSGAFLVEACRFLADQLVAAWTREGRLGRVELAQRREDAEGGEQNNGNDLCASATLRETNPEGQEKLAQRRRDAEGGRQIEENLCASAALRETNPEGQGKLAQRRRDAEGGGQIEENLCVSATLRENQNDDPVLIARRLVAQRCLYGVDKNEAAVELAKLSLWLVTLAKNLPFTFLDHSLRHGDSLVGLSFDQIRSFHWKPAKQLDFAERVLQEALDEAIAIRQQILELAADESPEAQRLKEVLVRDAEDATDRARLIGDAVVGAFFAAAKDKERENERKRRLGLVERWLDGDEEAGAELRALQREIRARMPVFHWMLEYPEVFYAERPDPLEDGKVNRAAFMDAFVGNPPFVGIALITEQLGAGYVPWLQAIFEGTTGKFDLCASFFRRAAGLIGAHGTIGLIATNTIAQGDTRASALQPLVRDQGLVIYDATRSMPWPGEAAVTVSVVHLAKGHPATCVGAFRLDGTHVPAINSQLRGAPERSDPVKLAANAGSSFLGCKIYGQGFVLMPEERDALIAKDPRNAEHIFPYLGGDEVNTSPTQGYDRYVISFGQMSLEEAERWPDLIAIVTEKVKPERDRLRDNPDGRDYKARWWQFGRPSPGLFDAIAPLERCLVAAIVSKHLIFSFQPTNHIFSHRLYVFPLPAFTAFAVLQSRVHVPWAWLLSSTLEERLNYSASDCFETFPFPEPDPRAVIPALEEVGRRLYESRAAYMIETQQGLTQTYNLLKDPDCHDGRIEELRRLHEDMDRAVLDAYGWTDLPVPPYCPKTPDERQALETFQDEVIDRLFVLNAERAADEARRGLTAKRTKGAARAKARPRTKEAATGQRALDLGDDG